MQVDFKAENQMSWTICGTEWPSLTSANGSTLPKWWNVFSSLQKQMMR